MQVIDGKGLLIEHDSPGQITKLIPKSRAVGENKVLVHWGLEEAQVLQNLGIPNVPSPIMRDYPWPGGFTPFEHQKHTAAFLTLNRRAYVFSEQGTAKTASCIWASDYLLSRGEINRVLVVCPVSIMDCAWRNDLFTVAMHRRVDVAHGSAAKRRKVIASDAEYVIINYDGVKVVNEELKTGGFDLIIVDECSFVKNTQSDRWKYLNALVSPDTWVWPMTGTPAAQSPADAYGLAKLATPHRVPKFFGAFRDKVMHKVTRFKWVPRPDAHQIVHEALQPAIRYTKAECLDLPPMTYVKRWVELSRQQAKYYNLLKNKMRLALEDTDVTAANAAVGMNKLLQVSCISEGTPVLTDVGWVPIETVTAAHKVWDGESWVTQKGAIYKGEKPVVRLDGIDMTPDHRVWVGEWATAEEVLNGYACSGFDRNAVRLPEGFASRAESSDEDKVCPVGMSVRLRQCSSAAESIPSEQGPDTPPQLRMPPRQRKTPDVRYTPPPHMDRDETTLHRPRRQRLEQLRRAWHSGLRPLAALIRGLLGRHAGWVCPCAHAGSYRQRRGLHTRELPLGYGTDTRQQHPVQRAYNNTEGDNDHIRSRKGLWNKEYNTTCEAEALRMGHREGVKHTYDLIDCGPRSRFVVRGRDGKTLIVHNCGAVYDDEGETLEFDISPRYKVLKEVIDESAFKVLIFVPFRSAIEILSEKLEKDGISAEVIDGSVSGSERTARFHRFQTEKDPKVLVVQPQAAAHGVTLTAADTVVWWGPVSSLEIYEQANARVDRPGQRNATTVVQLQGSWVEKHIYALLDNRIDVHTKLTTLYTDMLD